jgi:hypothetical protein
VRDRLGAVVAALTVPYLPQKSAPATPAEIRTMVAAASADLSAAIGYRNPTEP